jgi:hypothetical protein
MTIFQREQFADEPASGDATPKMEHVPVSWLRPCPENDELYGSQSLDDPDIIELINSIRAHGVREPIQISSDGVIISGHRRRFCAKAAGLRTVLCIRRDISYIGDREAFLKLLVEANSQRKKTAAMLMREALMKIDPEEARASMRRERQEKDDERRFGSTISGQAVEAGYTSGRARISAASMPFLEAAISVINEHRKFWPLSIRQIHYRLLGANAPLTHASKPGSTYINDSKSYKKLCNLLARGRVEGRVPWQAIDDERRPELLNNHYWNPGEFFKAQLSRFLVGYMRNGQQSQPDHIEIIAEKLTVKTILESVAERYSIPLTINRGMSGPTVKRKIVQRYNASRKRKLIVLVVSDLDPAGDAIAQDIRDSFERDFGIGHDRIEVYKAALNIDQVDEMELEPSMEAKDSSPTYDAFVQRYGITDAYELEALEPADLQRILQDAIEEVMDLDAYNAEIERDDKDAVDIAAMKQLAFDAIKTYVPDFPGSEGDDQH